VRLHWNLDEYISRGFACFKYWVATGIRCFEFGAQMSVLARYRWADWILEFAADVAKALWRGEESRQQLLF